MNHQNWEKPEGEIASIKQTVGSDRTSMELKLVKNLFRDENADSSKIVNFLKLTGIIVLFTVYWYDVLSKK